MWFKTSFTTSERKLYSYTFLGYFIKSLEKKFVFFYYFGKLKNLLLRIWFFFKN